MDAINCIRCYRLFTCLNINTSDGLCDACDGTYDPSCGAPSKLSELAALFEKNDPEGLTDVSGHPVDPLRNLKVPKDLPPGRYEVYTKDGQVVTSNVPTREAGTYYDPASVKANIDSQLRALRCIEALQELVRLKDLKTQIEMWVRDEVSGRQWPKMSYEERMKASDEYRRCKGAAWDNARKALEE